MKIHAYSVKSVNENLKFFVVIKRHLISPEWLKSIAVFLFISAVIGTEVAAQPRYGTAVFAAGSNPAAAKIGDLDGDGRNDIAIVNLTGDLQLLFNDGAGSFERASLRGLWSPGAGAGDLDIGDLNGDGRNDLAFAAPNGAVSVLLNRGNRVFSAPANYISCGASTGVAIGDLDADGDNDLADINQCNRAGILLNDGAGVFSFNGAFGAGVAARSIALADFNGDGFKDIVYLSAGAGSSRSAAFLFNTGNGTFGNPVTNYAGGLPSDLTVADFDNDGGQDIAVANAYQSQIIMLFLAPNGNFVGYSELDGIDTPDSIVASDLNGDGRTDMAIASRNNNHLSIFINRGFYNFDAPVSFSVGQAPVDIAAGKLDADSLPDLVAVNRDSGTVSVLLSGGVTSPPPPPVPDIALSFSIRSNSSARLVDLRWTGATAASVEIYRNGSVLGAAPNSGRYTDVLSRRARGTFRYKVCQSGGQFCSNEAIVKF